MLAPPAPTALEPARLAALQRLEQRLVRAALVDFGVFLYGPGGARMRPPSVGGSSSSARGSSSADGSSSAADALSGLADGAAGPHRSMLLDSRSWKRVKSREGLTAYRAREHVTDKSAFVRTALATDGAPAGPPPTSVAVVGALSGSLADTLYGLLAPSTADLRLRAGYLGLGPDAARAAVLAPVTRPTEDEPFRCAGVHWAAGAGGKASGAGAPPELVLLEATGTVDARVGYHVRCSVPWSRDGATALDAFASAPRAWMASVALFREVSDGRGVDVCARTVLAGGGGAGDRAAAADAAAGALAAVADAARAGQLKKLAWMVLERVRARDEGTNGSAPAGDRDGGPHPSVRLGGHVPLAARADRARCSACDRKFGALHSVGTCNMCAMPMCSRCRSSRGLHAVRGDGGRAGDEDVEPRAVTVCKACLGTAEALDARTAAEAEALRYGPVTALRDEDADEDEALEAFGWEAGASHRESLGRPSQQSRYAPGDEFADDEFTDEELGTWTSAGPAPDTRPRVMLLAPSSSSSSSSRRLSSSTNSRATAGGALSVSSSAAATSLASSMAWAGSSPSASDASSAWDDDADVDEEIDTAAIYHLQQQQQHKQQQQYPPPPPSHSQQYQTQPPYAMQPPYPAQPPYQSSRDAGAAQQDLWRTMAALRVAAESTYQLTRQMAEHTSQSHRR